MRHGKIEQMGTPQEVFEHPANAFVMDFLGNVNVFHGRVQSGRAMLGDLVVATADYPHDESRPAHLYVRPHELEIDRVFSGEGCLRAKILHLNPAGPVMRVQLLTEDSGHIVHAEVSHDRQAELQLKIGDLIFVSPRKIRVFVPDYAI